jgi:3-hydroxyacyl-CoA dehydrogenase
MEYTDKLKRVCVLGAGGKMGSGILLLTALEMAALSRTPGNEDKEFSLMGIDVSAENLKGVRQYIREQTRKVAEKSIVRLREVYRERKDLVENAEIIDQYILDVMHFIQTSTSVEQAFGSSIVFEAVSEDPDLKLKLLGEIERNSDGNTWYLTNTSSIPIHFLNEGAALGGRIIGFHFYNPPAVQRLVELIPTGSTSPDLREFSMEYASRLRKTVVVSNDVAGFIGNGHFMRDILFGAAAVEKLADRLSLPQSICMINRVTKDFLIRPMGIFQLTDYVGLDVCQYIMSVMDPHMKEEHLRCGLIERLTQQGVRGGQYPDGSQKDGFFRYEGGRMTGVYDPDVKNYVDLDEIKDQCDRALGPLPEGHVPWKKLIRERNKADILQPYFRQLTASASPGAKLAVDYGRNSCSTGKLLVEKKVAGSTGDVNTVLLTGFYHAYGPVNEYFNE